MLQRIRAATGSITFRICLGFVVAAFAIWGASDVVQGRGNAELVTFKTVDSITYHDFGKAKSEEVKNIQRNQGVGFSEEQIEKMGINGAIMRKLIRNKLMEFMINLYDLDFSDAVIADFIRGLQIFKDKDNQFDMDKFKGYLRTSDITTEEYSKQIKDYLASTLILGSFVGNAHIPKLRLDSIIEHMSERRSFDIASVSLTDVKSKKDLLVSDEQLLNFYNENKDSFKSPWTRDISYIVIDFNSATNAIAVSDKEVKKFFDENKEEFGANKFATVKADIKTKLERHKFDAWIAETAKSLEDEVAGGSTLEEIGAKYGMKVMSEKDVSAKDIEKRAGGIFADYKEQIYDMREKEVSYPAELNGGGILVFEIVKFIPEAEREFEDVKKQVLERYKIFANRQEMLEKLQAANIDQNDFAKKTAALGMSVQLMKVYGRADLPNIKNIPSDMLLSMFSSSKSKVAGPFITEDAAYMFVVRKITNDQSIEKTVSDARDNIASRIKEGLMEELLFYAQNQSNMRVKVDPSTFERGENKSQE